MFWPKEIWGKYATKLEDFKDAENSSKAVQALNAMVTNALGSDLSESLRHIHTCFADYSPKGMHIPGASSSI
jgi:phytoene/squalene synthetase